MKYRMRAGLLIGAALFGSVLSAQSQELPTSLSPNEIEIRMIRGGHGGCPGRCIDYRVTITGDGTVRYDDLASPPLPGRTRKVSVDDVVALTNEFVRARFFEASPRYEGNDLYRLQNGKLELNHHGAADGPEWDLSLTLGSVQKSVHLYIDVPEYLTRLRDLVDKMGGPSSWAEPQRK